MDKTDNVEELFFPKMIYTEEPKPKKKKKSFKINYWGYNPFTEHLNKNKTLKLLLGL